MELDIDTINKMFADDSENPVIDNINDDLTQPVITVDIDDVNKQSLAKAEEITKKLSDYYFDPKYIEGHPYIKNKIAQEVDSIRRLLKMLSVNETAQDTLIQKIGSVSGKSASAVYNALTTLQNTMLSIQNKLDNATASLEDIFMKMQENAEETFEDKAKEDDGMGNQVTKGSKEFIAKINEMLQKEQEMKSV